VGVLELELELERVVRGKVKEKGRESLLNAKMVRTAGSQVEYIRKVKRKRRAKVERKS
jgi:hypothetical protein